MARNAIAQQMRKAAHSESKRKKFLSAAFWVTGEFRALRGATGALPLDPTAFEKAGETFNMPSARKLISLPFI